MLFNYLIILLKYVSPKTNGLPLMLLLKTIKIFFVFLKKNDITNLKKIIPLPISSCLWNISRKQELAYKFGNVCQISFSSYVL